jgi:glycosyltransferase involved in cell wall biosynthesis/predicted metal-dependent phosphoesterase TrpH
MDFVTITDHDTIAGVQQLAGEPDVFISEELTAWFKGERCAVHVLCFGITPDDHEWLQAHADDVVACGGYLREHEIACALAHPFIHVAAPLTAAHRRTLAELFPVWETRNGLCAQEPNALAAIYIETHGGAGVGGSDDHAGIDLGRTWTEAPYAATPEKLLAEVRAGRVAPQGRQGSAPQWAHSTLIMAARALASESRPPRSEPLPRLAARLALAGDARRSRLRPEDYGRLLRAWLAEMELDSSGLLSAMQAADFSHSDLERHARRAHERKLDAAAHALRARTPAGLESATSALLTACVPALPYVAARAQLARGPHEHAPAGEEPVRVAVLADGAGSLHGVGRVLAQLREHGIPGHEVDVIGTDASVDRRLPAVTEIESHVYAGVKLGVPSLFALAETLTERRYDLVHVCGPGPTGVAGLLIARLAGIPVAAGFHSDLQAHARLRGAGAPTDRALAAALAAFYGRCRIVFSPSRAADEALAALGIPGERVLRWAPGVDCERFNPARYRPDALPAGTFNLLYVGRLAREKGVERLAEAVQIARDRDPRLHLVLAGRGPEEERLRARLGSAATFLGWVHGDALARAYASAHLLVFPSTADTCGQAILEAQASGLPVLAADAGGHVELIEPGRSGCVVAAEPYALASAIRGLARRGAVRERLATGALLAARERSWERSLRQLAAGWAHAFAAPAPGSAGTPEVARAA